VPRPSEEIVWRKLDAEQASPIGWHSISKSPHSHRLQPVFAVDLISRTLNVSFELGESAKRLVESHRSVNHRLSRGGMKGDFVSARTSIFPVVLNHIRGTSMLAGRRGSAMDAP